MDQCITVKVAVGEVCFFLSCVYASPICIKRESLWSHLLGFVNHASNIPWACIGDFNTYMFEDEKFGGEKPNLRSMSIFRDWAEQCGLVDLGFAGPMHTWSNGRVKERLDRCLVNNSWIHEFSLSSILHLNSLKSDHRPLLLRFDDRVRDSRGHSAIFRFQAAWLTNDSFQDVVRDAWHGESSW